MTSARTIGLCIALLAAAYLASNLTQVLHQVYFPGWPFEMCLLAGVGVTCAWMFLVATGIGADNLFFEGIVIGTITAILFGFSASMPISSKESNARAIQRKQQRQQLLQKEQLRIRQEHQLWLEKRRKQEKLQPK